MCTYSLLACFFVKSVNYDLSDVVINSTQKLRAGRKSRALGKLRAGIKCADQTPYFTTKFDGSFTRLGSVVDIACG